MLLDPWTLKQLGGNWWEGTQHPTDPSLLSALRVHALWCLRGCSGAEDERAEMLRSRDSRRMGLQGWGSGDIPVLVERGPLCAGDVCTEFWELRGELSSPQCLIPSLTHWLNDKKGPCFEIWGNQLRGALRTLQEPEELTSSCPLQERLLQGLRGTCSGGGHGPPISARFRDGCLTRVILGEASNSEDS